MKDKEVWKIAVYKHMKLGTLAFPDYEVSNKGRIRRQFKNGNVSYLNGSMNVHGYRTVKLRRKESGIIQEYNLYFHRLLLCSLVRLPKSGEECDHYDKNKDNNSLDNLRWLTVSENVSRSWYDNPNRNTQTSAKLSIEDRVIIRKRALTGESGTAIHNDYPQVTVETVRRWARTDIGEYNVS